MSIERKRLSTVDFIYEAIKWDIVELVYEPGEQIVESTLAKEREISRTPLRQALYRLELEGLVTKKVNGRMIVAEVDAEEARELFLVREVIEGLIAREAALHIAENHEFQFIIEKLERNIFDMREAVETNQRDEIYKHGSEFHRLLRLYSNNPTAGDILKQINARVSRYRRLGSYRDPNYDFRTPVNEHEQVLKHIKKKDETAAEDAMRNHIKRSLKNSIAAFISH